MRCVKCDGQLVTVRVADIDVDQCDRCGGIWFDAHELERVLRRPHIEPILKRGKPEADVSVLTAARPPPPVPDDERRGRCPRCKGEGYLIRVAARARLHIDTCAVCGGKWLDGGEIDVLRRESLGDRVRRVVEWVLDLDLG
jgi:Zn-finger nucleic acid-binding protein